MPKLAANLSMMYQEWSFLDRFEAAAQDGFKGVEFLFPYEFDAQAIAKRLDDNGLQQVLFNTVPGDFAGGERGLAAVPGRESEFRAGVDKAIDYACVLKCPRLHMMAGLIKAPQLVPSMQRTYAANLAWAADRMAEHFITGLIEPINNRDIPGYFLNSQQQAHDAIAQVGRTNLAVQMDFYHVQIVEGDIAMRLKKHFAGVGHIQIAGVPQRHEPSFGEVNFPYLLNLLDELDYQGWVGCEYRPQAGTREGLAWAKPWLG